jgi:hypothetical protein
MFRALKTFDCLSLGLLTLILSGCGGAGGSVASFQPTGTTAKSALTTALDAWKSGREKPGTIDSSKPAVQVQDQIWDSGRKLKEFQIGDEIPSADGPTRFKVKLTFDSGEPASEEAEYVVFGKDPLWVCRDKDYQKMTGQ